MRPTMEPRSLQFIAQACLGTLVRGRPDRMVTGVCIDSRKVQTGDLFVALRGEHQDGHDFLTQASEAGAAALLVRHAPEEIIEAGVVQVGDPRAALGRLGAAYRNQFDHVPITAVAGSNGKTTTKNLLGAIIEQHGPALFSEASFNNDIGVPLSLLRLQAEHQAAILEVGTNHPGELAPLLRMMRPRHGILTGIGPEHLEFFGDLDGVAQEEGWIAEVLPSDGCLFVHGDSPKLDQVLARCRAQVVRAGLGPDNDWQARDIRVERTGTSFELTSPLVGYNGRWTMRALGRHLVTNALLALAAGATLGVPAEAARAGLASCRPSSMRMEFTEEGGVGMINDAYNANVPSMEAALRTCQDLTCSGRRVAVLGDMAELGEHSEAAHREVGRMAGTAGLHRLITVGRWAEVMAQAAREAGLSEAHAFSETAPATECLLSDLRPGDLVLLKASRATRLEGMISRVKERLR